MAEIKRPPPDPDDPNYLLFFTHPTATDPVHRGWTIWYDPGLFQTGIVYRETKWHARSPAGDDFEATGYRAIIEAVDALEDMRGGPSEPRLPT